MKILIGEVQLLRIEMSKGGVINMDGQKVGDVLRMRQNTGGMS
jgi:hypothetical protein